MNRNGRGASIGRTAAVMMVVGMAAGLSMGSLPGVRVIGVTGAGGGLASELPLPSGATLSSIDDVSASPGGRVVVVGRLAGTGFDASNNQWVWEGSAARGGWAERVRMGDRSIADLPGASIGALTGPAIVNDNGEVLLTASVTGAGLSGVNQALLEVDTRGQVHMAVRFGSGNGPGSIPGMAGPIPFGGSSTDAARFGAAGALYASSSTGLIGPCGGGGGGMCMRTVVDHTQGVNPPHVGTAVSVTQATGSIGMSGSGMAVQAVRSSGYTVDDLTGLIVWNQWGIPSFAVRDGTTPVDAPGNGGVQQFVLSSSPLFTNTAPVGINSVGDLAFSGTIGVPPPPSALGGTVAPRGLGTAAVMVKSPGSSARVLAQVSTGFNAAAAAAPKLGGAVFTSFGFPVINSHGTAAFRATVSGPGARSSIWTTNDTGGLELVALTGAMPGSGGPGGPEMAGAQFLTITSEPIINRRGQIVFFAQVGTPNTATQPAATFDALIGYDPRGTTTVLARSGESIDLAGIGARTLTVSAAPNGRTMGPTGNDDGAPTMLTDDGLAVFRAGLAGGGGTVVLAVQLPTVSGACCAGATCAVVSGADCAGAERRFTGVNSTCAQPGPATHACCAADFDQSGAVTVGDLLGYVQSWFAHSPIADTDQSGAVGFEDLIGYVQSYLGGCR